MQMDHASRKDYDPQLFVPEERLKGMTENEQDVAREVIGLVLEIFLDYVEPKGGLLLGQEEQGGTKGAKRVCDSALGKGTKGGCSCSGCDKDMEGRFNQELEKEESIERYGAPECVTALDDDVPESVRHAVAFLATEVVRAHVRVSDLEEEVADLNQVMDRYEDLEELSGKSKDELN